MICRLALGVLLTALTASAVPALTQSQEPTFEVATLKRTSRPDRETSGFTPTAPGQFVAQKVPATALISYAYRGIADEVHGQPDWANNEFYTVIAKLPDGAKADQTPAMLRSFLKERFHLDAHLTRESREVMALVRAEPDKPSRGLERMDVDCSAPVSVPPEPLPNGIDDPMPLCRLRDNGMVMNSGGLPLTFLANRLGSVIGKRVVIDPELDGAFRFVLRYSLDLPGAPQATDAAPHIITAVREQLGLKLVERRAEVSVLMVDRLERPSPD